MPPRQTFSTIDEYLEAADPKVRAILKKIRQVAASSVPDATECISYQMPALRQQKVFFYFAAFKKHIGVYPPVQDESLVLELARFRGPKGNLQFPLDEAIPYELIGRVAQSLARQYSAVPK